MRTTAIESVRFEAPAVLERVAEHGDLFASVLELEQGCPTSPTPRTWTRPRPSRPRSATPRGGWATAQRAPQRRGGGRPRRAGRAPGSRTRGAWRGPSGARSEPRRRARRRPAADRRLGKLAFVERHVEGEPQMAAAERLGIGGGRPEAVLDRLVQDRETLAVERAALGMSGVGAGREVARDRELVSVGLWMSSARFAVMMRSSTGPLAATQPIRSQPTLRASRCRRRGLAPPSAARPARRRRTQVAVDAVLEDEEPVAPHEVEQPPAARRDEVPAGGCAGAAAPPTP